MPDLQAHGALLFEVERVKLIYSHSGSETTVIRASGVESSVAEAGRERKAAAIYREYLLTWPQGDLPFGFHSDKWEEQSIHRAPDFERRAARSHLELRK